MIFVVEDKGCENFCFLRRRSGQIMEMLQGNTYRLGVELKDKGGRLVSDVGVKRAQFWFSGVEKVYEAEGGGEVSFDKGLAKWIVPLSEEETFSFSGVVEWQARVLMDSGKVCGMIPKTEYLYDSRIKTKIGG